MSEAKFIVHSDRKKKWEKGGLKNKRYTCEKDSVTLGSIDRLDEKNKVKGIYKSLILQCYRWRFARSEVRLHDSVPKMSFGMTDDGGLRTASCSALQAKICVPDKLFSTPVSTHMQTFRQPQGGAGIDVINFERVTGFITWCKPAVIQILNPTLMAYCVAAMQGTVHLTHTHRKCTMCFVDPPSPLSA